MDVLQKQNIPKKIFQSWKTKDLQGKMKENVEKIKSLNPEYEHYLYDDNDCREFLLTYFNQNFVNAFDTLIPGAFKCDFWRYCVLYIHGGVYIDIDMELLVPLKDIILPNINFVSISGNSESIMYQGFIASIPKHEILWYSLLITFSNIVNRRFDKFDLTAITGSTVLGISLNMFLNGKNSYQIINSGWYKKIMVLPMDDKFIYNLDKKKKIIKKQYEGYEKENYEDIYYDDPRKKMRYFLYYLFLVLSFFIMVILLMIIRRYNKCIK